MSRARSRLALRSTRGWEDGVVEAPWVVRRGRTWYLLYSGSYYCNNRYAIGAARRIGTPYGAFRSRARPIQKSGRRWLGPGHNSVASGPDGRRYILFHAYDRAQGAPRCGSQPADNDTRHMLIRRLVFRNGWPATATGAPGRSSRRAAFVAGRPSESTLGPCGSTAACTDDLGRDVCAGDTGVLMCASGVTRCTCNADGHFESCGACVPR